MIYKVMLNNGEEFCRRTIKEEADKIANMLFAEFKEFAFIVKEWGLR